ncbi:hypothetical protein ACXZ1K_04810 [Pedobacter sp. PWIIR3]
MKGNLLLMEMHWMNGNRGDLVFRNNMTGERVRIKRMFCALDFVGVLVQQCRAFEAGAFNAKPLFLYNNNEGVRWVFHSHIRNGKVQVALMLDQVGSPFEFRPVFRWEGALGDFRASINWFVNGLQPYGFFDKVAALGKRLFGVGVGNREPGLVLKRYCTF